MKQNAIGFHLLALTITAALILRAFAQNGKIYLSSEDNDVCVVKAGPRLEMLAVNGLGEVCMASPAISNGVLYFVHKHTCLQ
jgi:hypothetical protein